MFLSESSAGICFASFFGFAAIMTLMVPYSYLNSTTALVVAFTSRHLYFAKYIIVIGALCGLIGGIVSTLVPLPRLLYALAQDGLLFSILGRVSQRTGVPVISSLFSGLFAGKDGRIMVFIQFSPILFQNEVLGYNGGIFGEICLE